ncbi:MAG: hypothetical protein WC659_05640 [Patescibacteria group bacterium]
MAKKRDPLLAPPSQGGDNYRIRSKIGRIMSLVKTLPYFNFAHLTGIEKNRTYLKILLSRYEKAGKVVRIKKGFYVTREYLDVLEKHGRLSAYLEFIARILYEPSYLSLEYVLAEHNLLTEMPRNFTLVSKNKTTRIVNALGNFFYHKITSRLFTGYTIIKYDNLDIFKATKAKALFDYLYLRKNFLPDASAMEALRLNMGSFKIKDQQELKKYIEREGSEKMKQMYQWLTGIWKRQN